MDQVDKFLDRHKKPKPDIDEKRTHKRRKVMKDLDHTKSDPIATTTTTENKKESYTVEQQHQNEFEQFERKYKEDHIIENEKKKEQGRAYITRIHEPPIVPISIRVSREEFERIQKLKMAKTKERERDTLSRL